MKLAWIFRLVFVPLLIAAIITSNCSAADVVAVACPDFNDSLALAARMGAARCQLPDGWTSSRSWQVCEYLVEFLQISMT